MRKTILSSVALMLLVAGTAQAAGNAEITITGNVVTSTCDVTLSNSTLDLGNYTVNDFSAVAKPITASQRQFTVGLNNCSAPTVGGTASLVVTGSTLGGNPTLFNTTGTNTGVMLENMASAGTYLKAGDKLTVATATTGAAGATAMNGKSVTIRAGLASIATGAAINVGQVNAPILFSFAYN